MLCVPTGLKCHLQRVRAPHGPRRNVVGPDNEGVRGPEGQRHEAGQLAHEGSLRTHGRPVRLAYAIGLLRCGV